MAHTDRAFRALARARTHCDRPDSHPKPLVLLDDPNVDLPPPPREADLAVRVGEGCLLHTEFQGYRDLKYEDRVFFYSIVLTVREPDREVHSFSIWTRSPPSAQRVDTIRRGGVAVTVHTIVLPEVDASLLLDRVVRTLIENDASYEERVMAAMAAMTQGRYGILRRAMEKHRMEAVIIEDFVDYGFDQGFEKGVEKGFVRGARQAVLDLLEVRGLRPDDSERARIEAEGDVATLRGWLRRAATATSVAEVLG